MPLLQTISDIFGDASFASTTAEMARRNIPQQLEQEAEALRCACLPLAEHAHRAPPKRAPTRTEETQQPTTRVEPPADAERA